MNLGETIYRLRTERNMSQGALADALDVSRQSVSKWENNSAIPELDKLLKMSGIFGVTLDELVGREAPTPLPQAAAPETVIRESAPSHRTLGIILVSFGLLTTLLLSILGGFVLGLLAGLPFTSVGCVLIVSTEEPFFHAAWCLFAVYMPLAFWFITNFMGYGIYIRFLVIVLWLIALVGWAVLLHRRGRLSAASRRVVRQSIILALVLLLLLSVVNRWMMHRSGLYTDTEPLDYSAVETDGY